jgi:hypothetical protein
VTNSPSHGARRVSRNSVTASDSANCSPVMLATKRPVGSPLLAYLR